MATAISKTTGIPVNGAMVYTRFSAPIGFAMKNLKRLVFGVLSSLLLAVGFVQAADHLDPMSRSLSVNQENSVSSTAPDCSGLCDVVDPNS
jgi:hypothetical protein